MLSTALFTDSSLRDFAVWLVAISLVAFGFRYAKEIIAFVLDEFYEFFVLKNPAVK